MVDIHVQVVMYIIWDRSGQDCRGRRPGILDAVHVSGWRRELVVRLGARRAPSLTQADGCAVHAGCGPGLLSRDDIILG